MALATCLGLSKPDEDEAPLQAALAALGIEARPVAWDDPSAEMTGVSACVIRSTWNYVHDHAGFLAWAERTARQMPLWNSLPAVRWNSHKGYLLALASAGVPVVPTLLVPRGGRPSLQGPFERWPELVVKPAVSAGSFGTVRASRALRVMAESHLHRLGAGRDMLVQPYLRRIADEGERALVFIDGALSHAVRKGARFAGEDEAISPETVPVADDERALAERILAGLPERPLYARVDLARADDGSPCLMELELIEPSLFLDRADRAADQLAAAIAARL